MQTLFDPDTVNVKATTLSRLDGHIHVQASLSGVPSLHTAERLRLYLEGQDRTSDVGLEWDGYNQTAILRTFVSKTLPVDATGYISGLLGPQAQRFA
jgi:hypothetical protein